MSVALARPATGANFLGAGHRPPGKNPPRAREKLRSRSIHAGHEGRTVERGDAFGWSTYFGRISAFAARKGGVALAPGSRIRSRSRVGIDEKDRAFVPK